VHAEYEEVLREGHNLSGPKLWTFNHSDGSQVLMLHTKRGLRTAADKKGGEFMTQSIVNLAKAIGINVNTVYSSN